METTIRKPGAHLSLIAALLLTGTLHAQSPQIRCNASGHTVDCRIDTPNVKQRRTEYRAVAFRPNDRVLIHAGGCVQTGGSGQTWKRFVNPSGPNSDRLYQGLISIPGVTGPDLARIQGFIGRWLQLPPTVDPNLAFLVVGYEDDGYSDNGYWKHDDGTGGQCRQGPGLDGGPAWVTIHIEHQSTPPPNVGGAPFDLLATELDPTGIPMNPKWGWELAHVGDHPNPATLCAGFPYTNPSNPNLGVGLGSPPCTTQSPSVNPPEGFNGSLCASYAQAGHLHGHLNWWAATFKGKVQWDDHTDWTQLGDDDYNFKLTPDTASGLTASNPQTIALEFDSDETVDHIDRGWWNDFHRAVDSNDGKTGGPAGAMIDGHEAVVTGLMGLDSEHGAYSELHPVYGLAIHLNNDPQDDQWALLVRNWGDEGFCSQDMMAVPTTTLSFFLPRPFATGGTANTNELYSNNDTAISVTTKAGGAIVMLDLGAAEQRTLVHGKIHFSWTLSHGAPIGAAAVAGLVAPHAPLAATSIRETEGPEATVRRLFTNLPTAKRAEVQAKLRKPPQLAYTRPVRRVAVINVPPGEKRLRPVGVANPRKAQLNQQRVRVICDAYGGRVPGLPPAACNQ